MGDLFVCITCRLQIAYLRIITYVSRSLRLQGTDRDSHFSNKKSLS